MKTLIVSFIIGLSLTSLTLYADAQSWTTANQITVEWDPVTVASGTVTYKTYTKPALGGAVVLVNDKISETVTTMTFKTEGRYFLGVSAVRTIDGVDFETPTISWSDVPTDVLNGQTFGIQYYDLPAAVGELRIQKR